ncbi:hypothetical protein [Luteimonas sp. MC1572]|uniref:hypothetical protein n=1 Tax=Luteimonas sp. MC1572 TaxID=2799325 RepID=UPI0018F0EDB6|nr:hypothetical protein [Luteimonas sp. MC1572]MBJ6983032.1 hypothetical protein [Luteimonas sp. MC1572]QQO03238.1 hypothetical protein JGR64_00180 [Luteimonas sp. MC1572]
MTHDPADLVSEALQGRCGSLTTATLAGGKSIEIHNIAWGRDMGELFDHITTNISPSPSVPHTVDVFTTDKVLVLIASESGAVLYRRAADEA